MAGCAHETSAAATSSASGIAPAATLNRDRHNGCAASVTVDRRKRIGRGSSGTHGRTGPAHSPYALVNAKAIRAGDSPR